MPRAKLTLIRKKCTREGCPLQGEIHLKCKAHNRTGVPCRGQPMNGQLVCRMHGGQEPNALKAAKQRIAYQQVLNLSSQIVAYDGSDPETPAEGLLREVSWSAQVAIALGEVCNALIENEQLTTSLGGQGHRLNGLMRAWSDERMNHAKLCKMALDAGVQQQQLDLVESRANQIVNVMLSLLSSPELKLSSDQIVEGRIVAARILRMASSPITY